jgi:biotin carboxyl carrier protein
VIYFVEIGGRSFEVEVGPDGVCVDGVDIRAELARVSGTPVRSLLADGASHRVVANRLDRGRWSLTLRGRTFRAEVIDERTRTIRAMTGAGAGPSGPRPVRAPMPGLIVKVEVAEGDLVEAGQGVVIVEAMKMENELRAEGAGRVTAVHVKEGDTVEKDQPLVDLAAAD